MVIAVPTNIMRGGIGGLAYTSPQAVDTSAPYHDFLICSPHASTGSLGETSFQRVSSSVQGSVTRSSVFVPPEGNVTTDYQYQNCISVSYRWIVACPALGSRKAFSLPNGSSVPTVIDYVTGSSSTDPDDATYLKVISTANGAAFFSPWNFNKGYLYWPGKNLGRPTIDLPGGRYSCVALMQFPYILLGTETSTGAASVIYDYYNNDYEIPSVAPSFLRNLLGGTYSPYSKIAYLWNKSNQLLAIDLPTGVVKQESPSFPLRGYRNIIPLHRSDKKIERFLLIPGGFYYDELEGSADYTTKLLEISFNLNSFEWQEPTDLGDLSHGFFSRPAYLPNTGELLLPASYPGEESYLFYDTPTFPVNDWRAYSHPWI